MLPKNLLSSYQQYKNDTDSIASWLASTAKQFGYVSEAKSKSAKKRAKARAADGATSQSSQGRPTYTVAIKDFAVLAEYLAVKENPPVQVPLRLGALLDRAIATRQLYSEAISDHLPGDDRKLESDDRHAFFLGVLQKVRTILTPRFPKNYRPETKVPKSMSDVVNMFENLDMQETSEAFDQAPDVTVAPGKPVDAEVVYKAERLDSLKEDFLAFHLLLSDLNKLRTEVNRTWEGYKQGMLDLVAASITTNTAVDLARSLEEDCSEQFKKHGGTSVMLTMFYNAQCAQAGTTEAHKERPGDDFNFKMHDIADVVFWPSFVTLSSFCTVIKPNALPEIKSGYFGYYDPSSNRLKKTIREKYKEDRILLMEILPEFVILCRGTKRSLAEDELTRGLRIMFETKDVSLWLAFATTLFLDIHHILRDEVDYCFKRLADTADFARATIQNNLDFHADLSIDNWPKSNDEAMMAFSDQIKQWIQDDPQQKAARELKRINIPKPFLLFRQHPWSCGLWKYYIQIQLRSIGVAFVNAWGSVQHCGHLYNAARQQSLVTKAWSDMEILFAIQGYGAFFTGGPPKDAEACLKRCVMALGASATNFHTAKNRKKNQRLTVSNRGPISLSALAPVLDTFRERYCEENPRFELRTEDVERILEKSDWATETDEHDMPAILTKDSDSKPRKAPAKKLPISKLLAHLRAATHAEVMELSYDYLTLHRFCWRLLRNVKDKCRDRLVAMYGPDYIERENQLPFIVSYILAAATNTKHLAEFLKIRQTDEVTSAILMAAAECIQEMLETEAGDVVGRVLREQLGIPFEFQDDD